MTKIKEEKRNITGIILAGGKSSRMNYYPKGLLKINGTTYIEKVKDVLQVVCEKVIVISNSGSYDFLGCKTYNNIVPNQGPLGGIISGLHYSNTNICLISPCDMPFLHPELFKYLLLNFQNQDAVVPCVNNEVQPLTGIYNKLAISKLKKLLEDKNLKMRDVIQQLNTKEVEITKEDFYSKDILNNINTPEDLDLINKNNR